MSVVCMQQEMAVFSKVIPQVLDIITTLITITLWTRHALELHITWNGLRRENSLRFLATVPSAVKCPVVKP